MKIWESKPPGTLWATPGLSRDCSTSFTTYKNKGVPRQAEVTLGVPGRLRPRIILTFGTTRVVGRQLYAPAAFTPGEIPGTHFQGLSRPQSTWFCRGEPVTLPGIDPGTVRLLAQCLNHYATPGTYLYNIYNDKSSISCYI